MQENIWEKEYRNPTLVTLSDIPAQCVRDFVRFLRKERKIEIDNLNILDLGCGNGKNSHYISEQGLNNKITGIEISETALKYARELAPVGNFIKQSIGTPLNFPDASFDIILDVTSSNSLNGSERAIYLKEIQRLLKPDGYFFLRTLCKDGDKNAQTLLKTNPGKEYDTYIMPELGLTERVFSKEDLIKMYSIFGEPLYLNKETHYTKFNNQSYKRNFWVGVWGK
ncbi:class I SAM-dependent methyltransferase [bacterium]|nr:class I SAM-dependent methyltransferase [bacterium]